MVRNTEDFTLKAKQVHGDKYDYSHVVYKKSVIKVKIVCSICHTMFEQQPNNHLSGQGCPTCFGTKRTISILHDKTDHLPYKFDFSTYVNSKSKITTYCPKHNYTTTKTVDSIINRKSYCPLCAKEQKNATALATATTTFIEKSKKVHKNLYSYEAVNYVSATTPVSIYCHTCKNYFKQVPHNHQRGAGCHQCAHIAQGWGKSRFVGKPTIFYVLNVKDVFKVGITTQKLKKRYAGECCAYKVVFQCTFFNGADAWALEKLVLRTFKPFAYKGPRLLTSVSNKEFITIDPLPNLQILIKDIYA